MKAALLAIAVLLAAIVLLADMPGEARELASAPEVEIVGFSRDGRTFAYEQFQNDDVSDEVFAAIDAIERDSGRSAKGFPFGFLGMSKNGEFPLRVGPHRIKKNDNENVSNAAKLTALRATIRKQTAVRLKALGVAHPGRRLAGRTITDRSNAETAVDFVLSPVLPGPVPDTQQVYRATARFAPADTETCFNDQKIADHTITLQIDALDIEGKATPDGSKTDVPWPAGDSECASALRITDVIAPPEQAGDGPRYIVVVALAISWGGHAESARYFAGFVRLP